MRKIQLSTALTLLMMLLLALPVSADQTTFPDVIQLPVGFRPEGIALGRGSTFYTGSLADGSIYRGDLRTGEGEILVQGQAGMISVGMSYDRRGDRLFVAGGATGTGRVYDAETGELLASYQLANTGIFINDVIVTRDAAYFTNSNQPFFYRVPLESGDDLPAPEEVEPILLAGEWNQVQGFNANGIEATSNGKWLVIVNATAGVLYRVDPFSGVATAIDLGGQTVTMGDGLLFYGSNFYVVRNRANQILEIDLSSDLLTGEVTNTLTDTDFNVPTTIAGFNNALYAVNAKFGAENPGGIPYEIVRVEIP